MTSSLDLIRGRQVVQTLTNKSGGGVIAGDVVIIDTANDESFTTTTTAAYNATQVCIALDTIASNATGRILLQGYAPLVNVSASATRGYYLLTHTVAKQATSGASFVTGAFGQVLKAGAAPSAYIFPPAIGSSAGITRSGSTTDAHYAVWNGSNADSLKDGGAALSTPAMVRIAQVVVGVGGASTIDFSSIPATYESLRIVMTARNDKAAVAVNDCWLTFNNDSGSNYDMQWMYGLQTAAGGGELFGQAKSYLGSIAAATATADVASQFDIVIAGYARTVFNKQYFATNSFKKGTTTGFLTISSISGFWRSTAAINQVTLLSTSDKFVQGSVATLYGIS